MTLTVNRISQEDVGLSEVIVADLTFDASYSRKGEPLTVEDVGFRAGTRIDRVDADPKDGYAFEWVPDALLLHQGRLRVLNRHLEDRLLTRPGLTIGTVSAKSVKHANAFSKLIAGVAAEVAAAETAFTVTTHDITADAALIQEAVYLISVGAAVTITKGATAGAGLAVPPATPAGEAVLGYVTIQVAAGATDFDATTDDLDAAHLTTTFEDADGEAQEADDLSALTVRATITGR